MWTSLSFDTVESPKDSGHGFSLGSTNYRPGPMKENTGRRFSHDWGRMGSLKVLLHANPTVCRQKHGLDLTGNGNPKTFGLRFVTEQYTNPPTKPLLLTNRRNVYLSCLSQRKPIKVSRRKMSTYFI